MTEALKPCPFCGGEAAVERRMLTGSYRVLCKSCLSGTAWLGQVMDCPTPPWVRLASRWNARAEPHVSETGKIEHDARDVLTAKLVEALGPFKGTAAELFARNWNRDDVVIALDSPGDPHRLTFGDFLSIHAALAEYEARE